MIKVADIINQTQSYPEGGALLYNAITSVLNSGKVELDMQGVSSIPSMFLHTSIGKLKQECGREALSKLIFYNITAAQAKRLKDYINAI